MKQLHSYMAGRKPPRSQMTGTALRHSYLIGSEAAPFIYGREEAFAFANDRDSPETFVFDRE